jgi:SAM-dependent methyltransferase
MLPEEMRHKERPMSAAEPTRFERMQERYRTRDLPWDHELPPPEIIDAAERLAPGRLLDLGCGTARASIYLAARGWQADAVDYVPEAIEIARERTRAAGQLDRVRLHVASVTDLSFLTGPHDLAIDVGCLHGLEPDDQRRYAAEVARLLRPGAAFLLFVHLSELGGEGAVPVSTPAGSVEALFAETFEIVHVAHGETKVADMHWVSAWYTLARR